MKDPRIDSPFADFRALFACSKELPKGINIAIEKT
jgi:hypothetical protein